MNPGRSFRSSSITSALQAKVTRLILDCDTEIGFDGLYGFVHRNVKLLLAKKWKNV